MKPNAVVTVSGVSFGNELPFALIAGPLHRAQLPFGQIPLGVSAGIYMPQDKALRDALGLRAGSTVDISRYGAGLQLIPHSRTARLVEEAGVLVVTGETAIDDDVVFGLIDAGRR